MRRTFKRIAPQIITLIVLAGLVSWFFPSFLQVELVDGRFVGPVIDILKRSAPIAILAVGMTLVVATGGIDLSVGSIMAITGAVAAFAIVSGWGVTAALLLAIAAGLLAGFWNGMLVSVLGIQPIVATLILMTSGRGIAQLITEGRILTFTDPGFAFIGSGSLLGIPFSAVLWMLTGALVAMLMRYSALGLLVEAVGINKRASALSGVNARALIISVYMASGFCAAIAGIIVTADIRGADANNAGLWLELDAILAVVIGGNSLLGGRFSIAAAVLGAMIIQTIDTGILLAGFPSEYNLVIKAVLILAILMIQSPHLAQEWALIRAKIGQGRASGRSGDIA